VAGDDDPRRRSAGDEPSIGGVGVEPQASLGWMSARARVAAIADIEHADAFGGNLAQADLIGGETVAVAGEVEQRRLAGGGRQIPGASR
jgi:hypothetical protein